MDPPVPKKGTKRKVKDKARSDVVESEVQPGQDMFRGRSPSKGPSDELRGDPDECSGLPRRASEVIEANIEAEKTILMDRDYLYLKAHHKIICRILPPAAKSTLNRIAEISSELEKMALTIIGQDKEDKNDFDAPEGWLAAEAAQDELIKELINSYGTFPKYKGNEYPSLHLLRYTFANKNFNRLRKTRKIVFDVVLKKVRSLTLSLTLSNDPHIDASLRQPRKTKEKIMSTTSSTRVAQPPCCFYQGQNVGHRRNINVVGKKESGLHQIPKTSK